MENWKLYKLEIHSGNLHTPLGTGGKQAHRLPSARGRTKGYRQHGAVATHGLPRCGTKGTRVALNHVIGSRHTTARPAPDTVAIRLGQPTEMTAPTYKSRVRTALPPSVAHDSLITSHCCWCTSPCGGLSLVPRGESNRWAASVGRAALPPTQVLATAG